MAFNLAATKQLLSIFPEAIAYNGNYDEFATRFGTVLNLAVGTSSGGGNPFADSSALVSNSTDPTKLLILSAASISPATTRTWTFPDVNGTVARADAAQTFTGVQTFSSIPIFSSGLGNATATTQAQGTNNTTIATTAYVDRLSLTISTGLTNILSTLTVDLSTGKSGGQSVIGGTGSGENLTLSSTSNTTKGSILFGTSSYSEVNNNFSYVLATTSSSFATTATATANNQYAINETGTITGRASVVSDATNGRLFDYTFVAGAGVTTPTYNGVVIKGTFPTGANGQVALLVNPTMNGSSASSLLVDLQAASTSKFKVAYSGDLTGSGTAFSGTYTVSAGFISPKLQISSSGTNADFIVFNSATTPVWRFRATNANVFTLNDGTNDIFTISSSLWTFNRVIKFAGTNTTGGGSALLGTNSPAVTNTAPYTWIQITTSDGSTAYIPCWK